MSALGQKRTFDPNFPHDRFAPKAAIRFRPARSPATNENGGTWPPSHALVSV
jgi:hypothetical protein